jgi:hypothetical protein
MGRDTAKIAAVIAVIYVVFFVGGIFHHYLVTGDEYALTFGLSRLGTWIAAVGGIVVAYGLWQHYNWAWWFGLVGVGFSLFGSSRTMALFLLGKAWPSFSMLVVLALFLSFLWLLLLPATRAAGNR